MKLRPFKEMLALSKEKIQEALAPVRAMQAQKQAELEIAKMDESIFTQEAAVNNLTAEYPVSFNRLIDALDELALMERRKTQFMKIKSEMFPETKQAEQAERAA